ncbi:hypothetical protein [Agrococcus casei]|uniref:hypothetical protein n=1 Tax=Agrococcus casei TaxID=343512 RepID=UPI003F904930
MTMAKAPTITQFKYKGGVLIRSAALSWRPGKWPLGPGSVATVAAGPSSGFLNSATYLTITTPEGEVLVIEAWSRSEVAKAHKMAAQITADAR